MVRPSTGFRMPAMLFSEIIANIDAVIFDMDGLIFDTERPIRRAVLDAALAVGFEMPEAFYQTMIGVPGPECDAMVKSHFGSGFPFDAYDDACRSGIALALGEGVAIKPGAAELLGELHGRRMPLALATSSGRNYAEHHLRTANLHHFFTAIATRNDVSRGKPHPDLFLKAAGDLGVAPRRCLVLEDSHNGVRAAHAAGCLPIMVPDLLEATDEMRGLCVAIAFDLHEVRSMFGNPGSHRTIQQGLL
jgi:HAD superfamily hydrolase (TIGR01509 family)